MIILADALAPAGQAASRNAAVYGRQLGVYSVEKPSTRVRRKNLKA
jgi:hypothetical protein